MVAQRVYGLVQGYEDLNDHDQLRHDPMFAIALGKLSASEAFGTPMAGNSTRLADSTLPRNGYQPKKEPISPNWT